MRAASIADNDDDYESSPAMKRVTSGNDSPAIRRKVVAHGSSESLNIQPSSSKPTFEQIIALQHYNGFWCRDKLSRFTSFFKDGITEDENVRQALEELSDNFSDKTDKETMYVTLLAIYVLTEVFDSKED